MSNETPLETSRHYVATIFTDTENKLYDCQGYIDYLHPIFEKHHVQNLGVLSHIFENGSFSLVVMLAESHVSIHTWPEKKSVQLDVFLCNYLRDNSLVGQQIFDEMIEYFKPNEKFVSIVERL